MSYLPDAHIITIKWGTKYPARDVNLLYAAIARNLTRHTLHFHCFTDDATELHPAIIPHPLPTINVDAADLKYVYRKEVGLCDDTLGGLTGKRVFFFDLDVLITGSLDELLDYPQSEEFVIINDWNSKGTHIGQASCYSFVVGTLGHIKTEFEARPKEIIAQYFTASQEYLSAKVIEKYGRLTFWPEDWCRSFKKHALPPWYLRAFTSPTLPEGCKVLAFHGDPKMDAALHGTWQEEKRIAWYKRFYKTIRPSPWIADYWRE